MHLGRRAWVVGVIGLCALAGPAWAQSTADAATGPSATRQPPRANALPVTMPIFPLPDGVLFPNVSRHFHIFEPRYRAMVADALEGNKMIGMVTLQSGYEADYAGRPPIYPIGCAGIITASERLADGRYLITLRGLMKFRVTGEDQSRPYRLAHIDAISEVPDDREKAALRRERPRLEAALAEALFRSAPTFPVDMPDEDLVNEIALYVGIDPADRQVLLEQPGVLARAQALIGLLELNATGPR